MSDYKFSIEALKVNKTYKKKGFNNNALINFDINIPKGSIPMCEKKRISSLAINAWIKCVGNRS